MTRFSFEFFPPSTDKGFSQLDRCAQDLARLGPEFVSVTYGAGGTTQDRTLIAVKHLIDTTGLTVAGHLTCVGATAAEVDAVIDQYFELGVRHIVALRGDPTDGLPGVIAGGHESATQLVAAIRQRADHHRLRDVEISVAAYPEVHPKAASWRADLDSLKAKLDAGADRAITQFFFNTDAAIRFVERARAAGITQPIVPGIMPVRNFGRICEFAQRCGTAIPDEVADRFAGIEGLSANEAEQAAELAAAQCRDLAANGITEFHFYTMNRAELSAEICRRVELVTS